MLIKYKNKCKIIHTGVNCNETFDQLLYYIIVVNKSLIIMYYENKYNSKNVFNLHTVFTVVLVGSYLCRYWFDNWRN